MSLHRLTKLDIVERLRAVLQNEQSVESMNGEAADEIERLRAGGCARDQRTTQYCAEAVRLQAERDEARLAYCRDVLVLYGDADEQYQLAPAEIARRKGWSNLLEILTGSPNRSPNRSEVAE